MSEATVGIHDQGAGSGEPSERRAFQDLLHKIKTKTALVAVIGLGHVGLPTAVVYADAGYHVTGVDIREDLIGAIASGVVAADEPEIKPLLERILRAGLLRLTTDAEEAVRAADVVIICVQTPVSGPAMGSRSPDLRHLESVSALVGSHLARGRLVVIESTVPPGTTAHLVGKILEKESGMTLGADFWLVHCPERMAPGNGLAEITGTARVVGGIDGLSAQAGAALWREVTTGEVVVTRAAEAELAKLAENSFRAVNIAFANELALLCERIGADVADVIRLANSHPRVKILNPGPGAGGPCIPKDPDLMIHAAKEQGLELSVLHAAQMTNARMPYEVSGLVKAALGRAGARNGRLRVAILGTAYKAGVSSAHNSPAETVIAELMQWGAEVTVYDPHCAETFGARRAETLDEALGGADCIVLLTEHQEFRMIDFSRLVQRAGEQPVIVDARRVLDHAKVTAAGFIYIGLGRGGTDSRR